MPTAELALAGAAVKGLAALRNICFVSKVAPKANKIPTGPIQHTKHSINQKINREVKSIDELGALRKPLKKTDIKFDNLGRPSQKFIGDKASVAVNPRTGKIVTVHPTSSKLAKQLKKQ